MARFWQRGDEEPMGRPVEPDGPSVWSSRLLPLSLAAVVLAIYAALAGWWLVMGELPGFDDTPRLEQAMPARGGPEPPKSALLKPPSPNTAMTAPERPNQPERAAAPEPPQPAPQPAPEPAQPATVTPAAPPEPAPPPLPKAPSGTAPPPSFAALPAPPPASALTAVPLPELVKKSPNGDLPVVGPGNRQSWQAYGRPFKDDGGKPRVAVLVTGLGLSKAATEAAIQKLPAEVSLAFSPYARDLQQWIKLARQHGHEVLLELPVEPPRYPARDPGPLGLLASLPPQEVTNRLEKVMGSAMGYVGLVGMLGSPFASSPALPAALQTMKQRGVLYVGDPGTAGAYSTQMPAFVPIGRVVDDQPFRDAIDARLAQVAALAGAQKVGLAVTEPLPVALERIAAWLPTLARNGLVLAPVSALAKPPAP